MPTEPFQHGIPHHDYFLIAAPPSLVQPTVRSMDPDYVKPIIQLQDPGTKETIQAEVNAIWTVPLDEMEDYKNFCLIAYGLEWPKLLNVLKRRYPEVESKQKFRFILLKKIA